MYMMRHAARRRGQAILRHAGFYYGFERLEERNL